jgi:hypothetical protein
VLYRYRLIDAADGNDLGPFVSSKSENEWKPGRTIPKAAGDLWRVTAVVEREHGVHDFRAYLVVERV